jgi:beta-lactam-binding protein with PASTA domain
MANQPTIAPPAMLATGSRVIIIVSKGVAPTDAPAYVSVPDILGKQQGDALSVLQQSGMSAQVFNDYSDRYKRGVVMGQLPPAGATAPAGTEAVMLVSSGAAASHTKSVVLPSVVGKTEAEAVNTLQSDGLSPQVVHEYSPSRPAGMVIAQLPNITSLAEQPAPRTNWLVWVATAVLVAMLVAIGWFFLGGGKTVAVPELVGTEQTAAAERIRAIGLEVGSVTTTTSPDLQDGTVAEQSPTVGTQVKVGSKIDLVVVSGKPLIAVPDVRKQNQADATRALQAAKLQVSVTRAPSSTVAKGRVIEQNPAAGQQVPEGTSVGIVISDGPQQTNVNVPDLEGLSQADAEKTLTDAGLKVAVAQAPSTTAAEGIVFAQSPQSGDSVAKGTTIAIVVSTGPPPAQTQLITIPDVVGLTIAEAQQTIEDAGLTAVPVAGVAAGKPANEVVAQSPQAGTKVAEGSSVVLFYSSGAQPK